MILIVDDEHAIADTMVAMMKLIGHRSTAAYSAEEAMAYLSTQEPELMISDVIMPGMNGLELAMHARRNMPRVRILLLSGNATTQDLMNSANSKGHSFELLAKPVLPQELLAKVSSMLGAPTDNVRCFYAAASAGK